MKPRHYILTSACFSLPLVLIGAFTGNLYVLAVDSLFGYIAQGVFVYYSTDRIAWELGFGILTSLGAVFMGIPSLQFLGRLIFIANAVKAAWDILKKRGY